MKPTLLILAAGMASRYGSMKQTEGFGPGGETIMDYSIFNAIRAGFGKVVFIIRKDFADNFKAVFNEKLQGKIEVDYVYQEIDSFIAPENINKERTKPWGTGHAMLCANNAVKEPFCVINADDFYGKDAFEKAAHFLNTQCTANELALVGYQLANTLSEHGTVSRGVCEVNDQQLLTTVIERTKIFEKEGVIVFEENNELHTLPATTNVSMNFWCFHPSIFTLTATLFNAFIAKNNTEPKAEFFIPFIAEQFLKDSNNNIHVIGTTSQWFGVTYKEDADGVRESLHALIAAGEYPKYLWQ